MPPHTIRQSCIHLVLFLPAILCGPAVAQTAETPRLDAQALIRQHGFRAADVGFLLFDPADGRIVAEHRADTPFIPASVAKVPSAVGALALLGPGWRFTTRLLATGPVQGGVLAGDLVLKGGGDPTLDTGGLTDLARTLAAQGIRGIKGRFLYDASDLPVLPEIEPEQPYGAGYNTGVSALTVNFNRAQVTWTRRNGVVAAQTWTVSDKGRLPIDGVTLHAVPRPGTLAPAAVPAGGVESWQVGFPATGDKGAFWMPVRRADAVTAGLFHRIAGMNGIALPPPRPGTAPATARPLAQRDSPPLATVAAGVLRYSNNLSAELIGLAAARRLGPTPATTLPQAAGTLAGWLKAQAPGTDWSGFTLANFSGLTVRSRVTPRQMAAILRIGGEPFYPLLPGEDEGKPTPGARAKSGTMAYVKGLAGVLSTAGGRRLGFVLFIADEGQRQAMDRTAGRDVPAMPPEARAWLDRARMLQAALLAHWVDGPEAPLEETRKIP